MEIAVCTYATKNYLHAWSQVVRRICAAVAHLESGNFIFATDESKESKAAAELLKTELPDNWKIHIIHHKIPDDTHENYKQKSQHIIAQLQGSAFAAARKLKCDFCWSVESDVLVPPDALKNLMWVLQNPDNYYEIAALTYPNSGFLGGFSTKSHWIAEDYLPHERILPARLKTVFEECEKRLKSFDKNSDKKNIDKEQKRIQRLFKKIKDCPPDGNIFEIIGKHGWRKRGWLDAAYPALSKGSIVPVQWHGLGCLLLNKRALSLATFDGYGDCGSTQDLFLFHKRWTPNNIKCALSTYSLCDHVKPELDKDKKRTGKYIHYETFFEEDGEYQGHLRIKQQDWVPL